VFYLPSHDLISFSPNAQNSHRSEEVPYFHEDGDTLGTFEIFNTESPEIEITDLNLKTAVLGLYN